MAQPVRLKAAAVEKVDRQLHAQLERFADA